ncbi:MAG: hypothetical protein JWO15_3871 [Sphingomonadales bacterium]|nr:hypothetical protein [Sphingomonadales bacterium]
MSNRPTTRTISEALDLAADAVLARGWTCGGGWYPDLTETTPVCAEGAIRLASTQSGRIDYELMRASIAAVSAHLELKVGTHPQYVFSWNDSLSYTPSDVDPQTRVVEVLRATAVIEQAREAARESTARTEDAARRVGIEVAGL